MRRVSLLAIWVLSAGLAASALPEKARVDINTASLQELMQVPGMTRTWAGRVLRFRPYRAKDNLLDRGVLPQEVYDRVKDSIVVHRMTEKAVSPRR